MFPVATAPFAVGDWSVVADIAMMVIYEVEAIFASIALFSPLITIFAPVDSISTI